MELILQKDLPHQQKAVDAVSMVFDGVDFTSPAEFYANPLFSATDSKIASNIRLQQNNLPENERQVSCQDACLNLDIKMETGTGKTYVYTKTIYELHRKYGINKFIIAVPSLAIKAGTSQFINDGYVKRHFADGCGYDTEIELGVLETPKKKKKGRSYFPSVVSDFVKGSCQNSRKIYVLLVNMQLLVVRSNGLLSRNDYDYGVEGFYRPFDALKATHSFVIIDEPHRFSRDQKAFQVIMNEIAPQCLIRFGATFPENVSGRGRNRIVTKDYFNLLYDLNACQSFNQGLIKGVIKEHFQPISQNSEKVKIISATKNTEAVFQHTIQDAPTRRYSLHVGDSLAVIHEAFSGILIEKIDSSSISFSNGIIKQTGETLDVDIYMTSYQEQMVALALQRHFEIERANFCNQSFRIKTLALFFIDDISSYRDNGDGKIPYLRQSFERLLQAEIEKTIAKLTNQENDYKLYLESSLADLNACHAGYFSQDNNDSDEAIAEEVDTILHKKKELLQFTKTDGTSNTLRFLFSKWTLKEGWDNPNVFTITKLRSSGSETSKMQEVGRGLRLPVDENGNRISNGDFYLNYIVDFTEADFAEKLVKEINAEVPDASSISEEMLLNVAAKLNITPDDLFFTLCGARYIDRHYNIVPENRDAFYDAYPDFFAGVKIGKVQNRNKEKPKQIKIRKAVFSELKTLWMAINQRYLLFYDNELNEKVDEILLSILESPGFFTDLAIQSIRSRMQSNGEQMTLAEETGTQAVIQKTIPYRDFLKRIAQAVSIPITATHKALCTYVQKHGSLDSRYINETVLTALCTKFIAWKKENLQGHFHYTKSNVPVKLTALTENNGTVKADIAQGKLGTRLSAERPCPKYLYEEIAYDSPLEKENILTDIDEIIVYGKIPRNSIAIPTTTGGFFSPDFMYVVKKTNGEKQLNVVVETKDAPDKHGIRDDENQKIECAKVFFATLSQEGYPVSFETQFQSNKIIQIIKNILNG